MRFVLKSPKTPTSQEELRELLLVNRGITDVDLFLNPPSPSSFTSEQVGIDANEMKKAIKRIKKAIDTKEKIVVFGDYDADGICASAVLWQTLIDAGADALPFIPDRIAHGYGLSTKAIETIIESNKPALIVTVDNGIVAHEAADFSKKQGIDLIISDHHQPEEKLPTAFAIVHTTQLCGTTVAWMIARELDKNSAEKQLDLCAIATIADQVKLIGPNRSFAFHGLKSLAKTERPGLLSLFEASAIDIKAINTGTVGFQIAPRINAAGRIGDGIAALRLLCTEKRSAADRIARELTTLNTERQDMTVQAVEHAQSQVVLQQDEYLLIAASTDYHEGVIGLVAGRLTEEFHKPSIVFAIGENSIKGSARSIPGINIVELIRTEAENLTSVGGHPMAAGLALIPEMFELVKKNLFATAKKMIDSELLVESATADCVLAHEMISFETIETIGELAPFGSGNPQPIFLLQNIEIADVRAVGKEGKHSKIFIKLADGRVLEALQWNITPDQINLAGVNEMVVRLKMSEWRGKRRIELVLN
ncbi:MAG: single-stranded-DNA-specific exonuclease RecJ [Candidatus Pacebacteria bacterium CG_4_10_14_0_8_um_filter_42_14]|nr:MAG: single-stranded-DNA-specific exonuclease RecJ [Candidatus Pacebacteria bacterium CG_4_10_14_0_8_um_filter_42_14]